MYDDGGDGCFVGMLGLAWMVVFIIWINSLPPTPSLPPYPDQHCRPAHLWTGPYGPEDNNGYMFHSQPMFHPCIKEIPYR